MESGNQQGDAHSAHGQVPVTVRLLEAGSESHSFRLHDAAPLADVLNGGLKRAGRLLSPVPDPPLDLLHNLRDGQVGPSIQDLTQPTGPYVRQPGTSHDFGITLALAIRVNTRWRVATSSSMTPRQILELFKLDFQEFSLYRVGSAELLALDTPIALVRGAAFEAQRDGKYGQGW